jgi:hypothetical protein
VNYILEATKIIGVSHSCIGNREFPRTTSRMTSPALWRGSMASLELGSSRCLDTEGYVSHASFYLPVWDATAQTKPPFMKYIVFMVLLMPICAIAQDDEPFVISQDGYGKNIPDSIMIAMSFVSGMDMTIDDGIMIDAPVGQINVYGIGVILWHDPNGTSSVSSTYLDIIQNRKNEMPPETNSHRNKRITMINYKISETTNYHYVVYCRDSFAYVYTSDYRYGEVMNPHCYKLPKKRAYLNVNMLTYQLVLPSGTILYVAHWDKIIGVEYVGKPIITVPDYSFPSYEPRVNNSPSATPSTGIGIPVAPRVNNINTSNNQ